MNRRDFLKALNGTFIAAILPTNKKDEPILDENDMQEDSDRYLGDFPDFKIKPQTAIYRQRGKMLVIDNQNYIGTWALSNYQEYDNFYDNFGTKFSIPALCDTTLDLEIFYGTIPKDFFESEHYISLCANDIKISGRFLVKSMQFSSERGYAITMIATDKLTYKTIVPH